MNDIIQCIEETGVCLPGEERVEDSSPGSLTGSFLAGACRAVLLTASLAEAAVLMYTTAWGLEIRS